MVFYYYLPNDYENLGHETKYTFDIVNCTFDITMNHCDSLQLRSQQLTPIVADFIDQNTNFRPSNSIYCKAPTI